MTIAQLIKHLEHYNPNEIIAYDLWMVDDVMGSSNDHGAITRSQAEEVLHRMEHRKDASIGLNWDVLNYYLDQVMEEETKGGSDE
jgi:hypothetical protein